MFNKLFTASHSFKPMMQWSITSPRNQRTYKEKTQVPNRILRFYQATEIGNRNNENSSQELTRQKFKNFAYMRTLQKYVRAPVRLTNGTNTTCRLCEMATLTFYTCKTHVFTMRSELVLHSLTYNDFPSKYCMQKMQQGQKVSRHEQKTPDLRFM